MNPEHELKAVLEKLAAVPIDRHRSEIEKSLRDAGDLASLNEWGVALETLCENLYEWDFPLTRELFIDLQRLASQWGLEPRYMEMIQRLLAPNP